MEVVWKSSSLLLLLPEELDESVEVPEDSEVPDELYDTDCLELTDGRLVGETSTTSASSLNLTLSLTYETGGIGGAEALLRFVASKELAAAAAGAVVEALLVLAMLERTLGFSIVSALGFFMDSFISSSFDRSMEKPIRPSAVVLPGLARGFLEVV